MPRIDEIYEIGAELGRGGMGVVYQARHRTSPRALWLFTGLPLLCTSFVALRSRAALAVVLCLLLAWPFSAGPFRMPTQEPAAPTRRP